MSAWVRVRGRPESPQTVRPGFFSTPSTRPCSPTAAASTAVVSPGAAAHLKDPRAFGGAPEVHQVDAVPRLAIKGSRGLERRGQDLFQFCAHGLSSGPGRGPGLVAWDMPQLEHVA